jgi:hypothetical protein
MEGERQVPTSELNCTGQDSVCSRSPERSQSPDPYAAPSDRIYLPQQKSYVLEVLSGRDAHRVEGH